MQIKYLGEDFYCLVAAIHNYSLSGCMHTPAVTIKKHQRTCKYERYVDRPKRKGKPSKELVVTTKDEPYIRFTCGRLSYSCVDTPSTVTALAERLKRYTDLTYNAARRKVSGRFIGGVMPRPIKF